MWNKIKSLLSTEDELEHIELFQLEGLIRNQIPFLLLDLRSKTLPTASKKLEGLLINGEKTDIANAENFLIDKNIAQEHPVVLICDNGKSSKKLAKSLRKKGRVNVYVVNGGAKVLEKELV